jgi:hypothetical protein
MHAVHTYVGTPSNLLVLTHIIFDKKLFPGSGGQSFVWLTLLIHVRIVSIKINLSFRLNGLYEAIVPLDPLYF